MPNESEEVIVLVKKPNAMSIVCNYFSVEANERGAPKQHKDKKRVC